jgi:hypothetical protein
MDARPRTLLICCGAIADEIVTLVRENGWDHMRIRCLPAHLHQTPERIPQAVRGLIEAGRESADTILVLYADCGTGGRLDQVLAEEGVERIGGTHCYEVFAGLDNYAELIKAEPGSFFLTDFLARHFDRLVLKGLGIDRFPKLRDIYFGKYRKMVYLAQTRDPALRAKAEAVAANLGLAFEMRYTGYGGYREFLAARQA